MREKTVIPNVREKTVIPNVREKTVIPNVREKTVIPNVREKTVIPNVPKKQSSPMSEANVGICSNKHSQSGHRIGASPWLLLKEFMPLGLVPN